MKRTKKQVWLVLVGLVYLSLAACNTTTPGQDVSGLPSDALISREDYPIVDGSTATLPLSRALMSRYTGITADEAEVLQVHTKTDTAYYELSEGRADLILVYEGSEDTMYHTVEQKHEHVLEGKIIGYDALVFLTNDNNAVSSLTTSQLQSIYGGTVTNWKDVGGNDQPIIAYQRNIDSGSQTMFLKLVMTGKPVMDAPSEYRPGGMGGLLESISQYKNEGNAIGFSVYYYVKNMYVLPDLKLLAVDGVDPNNETIRSGDYPFVNPFYAYIRADEPTDSPARQIYDFLTTEEGKAFIEQCGYVAA